MTLGLDISTSVIGISLLNKEGKVCSLEYIKFKQKISMFQKMDDFVKHIDLMSDTLGLKNEGEFKLNHIAIEEPLKKFKGKFSNADTIQKLTQINAMVSYYLYNKFGVEPRYYNVNTARKTVFPNLVIPQAAPNKKYIIWEKVVELEPQINWKYSNRTHQLMTENFDMSDALIISKTDFIVRKTSEENLSKEIL